MPLVFNSPQVMKCCRSIWFVLVLFSVGCVSTDQSKPDEDSKMIAVLKKAGITLKKVDAATIPEERWADTYYVTRMSFRNKDEKIPERVESRPVKLSSAVFDNVLPAAEVSQQPRWRVMSSPAYPRLLAKQKVPGRVVLGFVVGIDGRVGKSVVIKATSVEFADVVTTAVSQWTFHPGKLNGVTVPTLMVMAIEFETIN